MAWASDDCAADVGYELTFGVFDVHLRLDLVYLLLVFWSPLWRAINIDLLIRIELYQSFI